MIPRCSYGGRPGEPPSAWPREAAHPGPVVIEGIASAFDRTETHHRREAALYRIEAAVPVPAGDLADPRPGKRNGPLSDAGGASRPDLSRIATDARGRWPQRGATFASLTRAPRSTFTSA